MKRQNCCKVVNIIFKNTKLQKKIKERSKKSKNINFKVDNYRKNKMLTFNKNRL